MNQDESKFEEDFGAILRSLKQDTEPCPANDRLVDWQAGDLPAREAERVAAHLKACPECWRLATKLAQEPQPVDEMSWARARRTLDQRSWPWQKRRTWNLKPLGLIAAGVAAVAVALFWLQPSPPPDIAPVTRSAAPLTVLAPSGPVSQLEFRWQAVPIHYAYVVEIAGERELITSIETFRPPLRADAELLSELDAGKAYRWRVVAVDSSGRRLAESQWTGFQLRE